MPTLSIVNGDFETGDLTGWSVISAGFVVQDDSPFSSHTAFQGLNALWSNASGNPAVVRQIYDFSGEVDTNLIDSNNSTFDCSCHIIHTTGSDSDTGYYSIQFLDASDTPVGSAFQATPSGVQSWTEVLLSDDVPANARKVQIDLIGNVAGGGSTANLGWDVFTMDIVQTSPPSPSGLEQRVTQVPILTLDASNQPVRITQIPILTLAVEGRPTRVTQAPILVAVTNKLIPLPKLLVPETPVVEIWEWLTVVTEAGKGREQRSALRERPRYRLNVNILIEDDEERRAIYAGLWYFFSRKIIFPMYQYSVMLDFPASIGDTDLFFDPSLTDMREGEAIALIAPDLNEVHYYEIESLDGDGVTLTAPLEIATGRNWRVAPAPEWQLSQRSGFAMQSLTGASDLVLVTVGPRQFERPGAATSLPTLGGIPILTNRPLADNSVGEGFRQDVRWLDNETSIIDPKTMWVGPKISGEREFIINDKNLMDYWREFGDYCRGRQNPFLLPTYRDDLPLSEQPALSATEITTSNVQYGRYFFDTSYRYIYIKNANGFLAVKVNDIVINYNDISGIPETITLKLASSIGSNPGDNDIEAVSIMNLCRLNNDNIRLDHFGHYSKITMDISTVSL